MGVLVTQAGLDLDQTDGALDKTVLVPSARSRPELTYPEGGVCAGPWVSHGCPAGHEGEGSPLGRDWPQELAASQTRVSPPVFVSVSLCHHCHRPSVFPWTGTAEGELHAAPEGALSLDVAGRLTSFSPSSSFPGQSI